MWLVNFNANKTEAFLGNTQKTTGFNYPTLYLSDGSIQDVNNPQNISASISPSDWIGQTHVDYITQKAWSRMNLLRKLKFVLDRKSLQKIYYTFIRPILWSMRTLYGIIVPNSRVTPSKKNTLSRPAELSRAPKSWQRLANCMPN